MEKGKRVAEKEEKFIKRGKRAKQTETKYIGLRIFAIILFIYLAIYVGFTIRNYYILNTYAVAMKAYGKIQNYSVHVSNNNSEEYESDSITYHKDNKTVFKIQPKETRMMQIYTDIQTKEKILKIDSDGDKVAVVSKEESDFGTGVRVINAFGGEMTSWQNFLLALTTRITQEKCNGKECYKISVQGMNVWIDKETYLTTRISNGYRVNSDGSKIPMATDYKYEFGTVTNEQVAKPDLTGYRIEQQ